MMTLGDISDVHPEQNSAEIEDLGRFTVEEYNKKENALLHFSRVTKKAAKDSTSPLNQFLVSRSRENCILEDSSLRRITPSSTYQIED